MKTLRIISRFFLLAILTFLAAAGWQYWQSKVQFPPPIWLALARASASYYGQATPPVPSGLPSMAAWLAVVRNAAIFGGVAAAAVVVLVACLALLIRDLAGSRAATKDRRALTKSTQERRPLGRPQLTIGGVPQPRNLESRHDLFAGVTGAGKSVAAQAIIQQIRGRGDSAVVIDYRGELMQHFWREGDTILNPFDSRSAGWSPCSEVRTDYETEHLLAKFLPLSADPTHNHFQMAARQILEPVFRAATNNLDLWRTLTDRDRLEALMAGSVGEWYTGSDTRSAGDNMTTLINAVSALKYLPPDVGRDGFSIRRWVHQVRQTPGPCMWLTVPRAVRAALRPLLPLWAGLAISAVLELPDSESWKLWLLLDELGQLPPLDELADALTAGRKPGLGVKAGVQGISQLRQNYGHDGAQTLMSCFSTTLILRQADPDSADYFSRKIGDHEVREWHASEGESAGGEHATHSSGRAEHVRIKRQVLPAELRALHDLEGYLLMGHHPVARVTLSVPTLPPKVIEPFTPWPPGQEPTCARAVREAGAPEKNQKPAAPAAAPSAPEPRIIFQPLATDSSGEAATKVVTGGSEKCEE